MSFKNKLRIAKWVSLNCGNGPHSKHTYVCCAMHDGDEIKEKYFPSSLYYATNFMEVFISFGWNKNFKCPCVSLTAVKTHQLHYISISVWKFFFWETKHNMHVKIEISRSYWMQSTCEATYSDLRGSKLIFNRLFENYPLSFSRRTSLLPHLYCCVNRKLRIWVFFVISFSISSSLLFMSLVQRV